MKRPQLTLRDLFWLVLVAGMACAWWLEREERRANARADALRAHDYWAKQRDELIQNHQRRVLRLTIERDEALVALKNLPLQEIAPPPNP